MNVRTIPAITLYQPWASLVAARFKRFEFRNWAVPERYVGNRVAIHAGAKTEPKWALKKLLERYQGTAVHPIIEAALREELPRCAVLCTVIFSSARLTAEVTDEDVLGDDFAGSRFAWPIEHVRTFPMPIPAVGKQGFWKWTYNPAERPAEQLTAF